MQLPGERKRGNQCGDTLEVGAMEEEVFDQSV